MQHYDSQDDMNNLREMLNEAKHTRHCIQQAQREPKQNIRGTFFLFFETKTTVSFLTNWICRFCFSISFDSLFWFLSFTLFTTLFLFKWLDLTRENDDLKGVRNENEYVEQETNRNRESNEEGNDYGGTEKMKNISTDMMNSDQSNSNNRNNNTNTLNTSKKTNYWISMN